MSRFWSSVVHGLSPYVPGEQPKKHDGTVKLNTNLHSRQASRILTMHHFSLVDDKCLLGNPRAEMHILLGKQDRGTTRSQFPQYLADGGDFDRSQPSAQQP